MEKVSRKIGILKDKIKAVLSVRQPKSNKKRLVLSNGEKYDDKLFPNWSLQF